MAALGDQNDLLDHLERTAGLSRAKAAQVVNEILAYFFEPLDAFIRRRHRELRQENLRNEEIFSRILDETQGRRFAAPPLTARQVRRSIYG